jgi:7-cyano-7-deazaguanine synthase
MSRRIHFLRKSSSSLAPIPRAPARGARACVVLLSGGLDSATCLALVSRWGWKVHALSFDYGQRHRVELSAARVLSLRYRVASYRVIPIPALGTLGGSALTDGSIRVPKKALGKVRIPITYVPARNTLFLAFALGVAETIGAMEIVIGANALDYSGYPDCRPAFLRAFERVARLGTKAGAEGRTFTIRAPLLRMTKAEIVRLALALGLDTGLTMSCYDPGKLGRPCGSCDSCLLRAKGFEEAGAIDARALHVR